MTETGHFEAEGLWFWGSEETSLVLSWGEYNAGKLWEQAQLWEPGINIELLTELLFLFEKSLGEYWRIFSSSSSPSYNQHYNEILIWQATSLYLSGQWSMDYGLFREVDNLNYLTSWGVFTVTCSSELKKIPVAVNNVPFIQFIARWHSVQIPSLSHVRLLRTPVGNLLYILSLSLGCNLSVK